MIIVNGFQSLFIITKRCTLDVAALLDPPTGIAILLTNFVLMFMFISISIVAPDIPNCRKLLVIILLSNISFL